jgi:hypothetical protein
MIFCEKENREREKGKEEMEGVAVSRLSGCLCALFKEREEDMGPQRLKEMIEDGVQSRRYRTVSLSVLGHISALSQRKELSFAKNLAEEDFVHALTKSLSLLHYPKYADFSTFMGRLDVLRFLCAELQVEKMLWKKEAEKMQIDAKDEKKDVREANNSKKDTVSGLDGYMNKICTDLSIVEEVIEQDATPAEAMRAVTRKLLSFPIPSHNRPKLLKDRNILRSMSDSEMALLKEIECMLNSVRISRLLSPSLLLFLSK